MYKRKLVAVSAGTFYLDHGHDRNRKRIACGDSADAVKRAIKTQTHVLELRRRGMDVEDAPEIQEARRPDGTALRDIAKAFNASPPAGFTKKTKDKYRNALVSFATWAAGDRVFAASQVTGKVLGRWISHMLNTEELDASTIVPKVRIVIGELKRHGVEVKPDERDMPTIVEREREIYSDVELENLFKVCQPHEFELYQTFLLTGLRYKEVAFLTWDDVDAQRSTIRVTRKRDLGFTPKAYHERTVPVPRSLLAVLSARGERLASDGAGLIFGTSRAWGKRGNAGGKADRKMLDKLKQVARREGLNCGRCVGFHKGGPVTCKTHAVCKRWGLHKFRHTYATSMLRDRVDIVTVSKWLGHKDLATTRIYLRALDAEQAQPQVEQSTLAKRFAGHSKTGV